MAASHLGVLAFLFVFWLVCHTHSSGMALGGSSLEVWAGGHSSVLEETTWLEANSALVLFACTLVCGQVRVPQSYLRAILASDGVAIFWVFDKRHIHTNQGSPIRGYYLASDQRNQAEREKETWVHEAHAEKQRKEACRSPLPGCGCSFILAWYLDWEENFNIKC